MIWQDLKTYYKPYTDDFIILENQLAKLKSIVIYIKNV